MPVEELRLDTRHVENLNVLKELRRNLLGYFRVVRNESFERFHTTCSFSVNLSNNLIELIVQLLLGGKAVLFTGALILLSPRYCGASG